MDNKIHAVTGAFGYSGKYIAKKLIDEGRKIYERICKKKGQEV
jgi:GDP-D-mannose dehydratase